MCRVHAVGKSVYSQLLFLISFLSMDKYKYYVLYFLSQFYCIWANVSLYFQDAVEKWKSNDTSTNAAEATACNLEASEPGLLDLYSRFLAEGKKHNAALFKKTKIKTIDPLHKQTLCVLSKYLVFPAE